MNMKKEAFKQVLIPFIKGLGFAVVFLGAFFLFFYILQSESAPVEALNLRENEHYSSGTYTSDTEILFTLNPESVTALMISPVHYHDVSVRINGEYTFQLEDTEIIRGVFNHFRILDLREYIDTGQTTISFMIKKGGRFVNLTDILKGNYHHLLFMSILETINNSYVFFILTGLSLLLAFITFMIAFYESEKKLAYIFMGIFALYFGIMYPLLMSFRETVSLSTAYYLSIYPKYDFLFTILLIAGLEKYLFNRFKFTKIFITGGVVLAIIAGFFGFQFFQYSFEFLSIVAFVVICLLSRKTFLNFILWVNILTEIHDSVLIDFYPYMKQSSFGISACIVLFGLGSFLINDFKHQNQALRVKKTELEAANEEMFALNEELESSYQEIENKNAELEERVEERTQQLRKKNNSLKTLLNNTGEGFCKFDNSLLVESEYSRECTTLFDKKNLEKTYFPSLIARGEENDPSFVESILKSSFSEQDHVRRNSFLTLLPDQTVINSRIIQLKYRSIFEDGKPKIMLIARDITEEMALRDEIHQERVLFNKIVKIVMNYRDFNELQNDYTRFFTDNINRLLHNKTVHFTEIKNELYRIIHTYKGNFACYGLDDLTEKLHQMEISLREEDFRSIEKLSEYIHNTPFEQWLETEMKEIYEIIDPEFFTKSLVNKKTKRLIRNLEEVLSEIDETDKTKQALSILRRFEQEYLMELLVPMKNLVNTTADRLNVPLNPLTIAGDDILVNPEKINPLLKSLIHIFRNSLDHGIEDADERVRKGKPEKATIAITISEYEEHITLAISDDGDGIDKEKIIKSAKQRGILEEDTEIIRDEDLHQLLFMQGFSTTETINRLSGFGTGLASVERETRRLGGEIRISSEKNVGTTVTIDLPGKQIT